MAAGREGAAVRAALAAAEARRLDRRCQLLEDGGSPTTKYIVAATYNRLPATRRGRDSLMESPLTSGSSPLKFGSA